MVKKSVTEKHSPVDGEGKPETAPADKYFPDAWPGSRANSSRRSTNEATKRGRLLPWRSSPIHPEEIEHAIEVAEQDGHSSPASFIARHFMGEAVSYLRNTGEWCVPYMEEDEVYSAYVEAAYRLQNDPFSSLDDISWWTIVSAYTAIEAIESGDAERASIETLRYAAFGFYKQLLTQEAKTEALDIELERIYEKLEALEKERRKRNYSERPRTTLDIDEQAILRKWAPGYTRMPKNNAQRLVIALLDIRNDAKKYNLSRRQIHRAMLEAVLDIASRSDPKFDRFAIPGTWDDIYDLLERVGARKAGLLTVNKGDGLRKYAKTDRSKGSDRTICSLKRGGNKLPPPWPGIFPELYKKETI